jgi:hypothetical protein
MLGRGLYLEIAQIEEQHVSHYESLADPNASWFERLVLHEYNECWLYYSMAQEEPDPRAKKLWEQHLGMEIEHLRIACDLMKRNGKKRKRDPEKLLPAEMPDPFKFESNIGYVREVISQQIDYNAHGTEFVPGDQMPADSNYEKYQKIVNADGVPSEPVIEKHVQEKGGEYRQELQGTHPAPQFRL